MKVEDDVYHDHIPNFQRPRFPRRILSNSSYRHSSTTPTPIDRLYIQWTTHSPSSNYGLIRYTPFQLFYIFHCLTHLVKHPTLRVPPLHQHPPLRPTTPTLPYSSSSHCRSPTCTTLRFSTRPVKRSSPIPIPPATAATPISRPHCPSSSRRRSNSSSRRSRSTRNYNRDPWY